MNYKMHSHLKRVKKRKIMSISDLRKQKWETGGVLRCLDFILRAWRDMESCETGQERKSVCPAFIPVTAA